MHPIEALVKLGLRNAVSIHDLLDDMLSNFPRPPRDAILISEGAVKIAILEDGRWQRISALSLLLRLRHFNPAENDRPSDLLEALVSLYTELRPPFPYADETDIEQHQLVQPMRCLLRDEHSSIAGALAVSSCAECRM